VHEYRQFSWSYPARSLLAQFSARILRNTQSSNLSGISTPIDCSCVRTLPLHYNLSSINSFMLLGRFKVRMASGFVSSMPRLGFVYAGRVDRFGVSVGFPVVLDPCFVRPTRARQRLQTRKAEDDRLVWARCIRTVWSRYIPYSQPNPASHLSQSLPLPSSRQNASCHPIMGKRVCKFKKAPGAPRRFTSAYMFFSTQKHKQLRAEFAKRGEMVRITVLITHAQPLGSLQLVLSFSFLSHGISASFAGTVHDTADRQASLCRLEVDDEGRARALGSHGDSRQGQVPPRNGQL